MNTTILLLMNLVGLGLAVLYLRHRVDRMPARVWDIARREINGARLRDHEAEEKALYEATDRRVTALVVGLKQYHGEVAAHAKRLVSDAEIRARVIEQHSANSAAALEAATVLVRELRAMLAEAEAHRARAVATGGAAAADADEGRATVEMPGKPPNATTPHGDSEPEEELTTVTTRGARTFVGAGPR